MRSYLLVAHQTAQSEELLSAARGLHREDPTCQFVMLVPATPVAHMLVWEEGETREVAQRAADLARGRLEEHGLNVVEATIGDSDPVHAIGDELRKTRRPFGAIVLSTLPAGRSRWLRLDVISRVRRHYPCIRVIHVESRARTAAKATTITRLAS
jgi:hypothetical protein